MQISEQELRGMIREAIARHSVRGDDGAACVAASPTPVVAAAASRVHGSHLMFTIEPGSDGTCIIEPSVACNHCGYCKSMGH